MIYFSHVDQLAVAIAFPERHPMGIDVEIVFPSNTDFLSSQFEKSELNLLSYLPLQKQEGLTLLWSAKEALSKVLKTGFTVPLKVFSIEKVENFGDGYM